MNYDLFSDLPANVGKHFSELIRSPRPSGQEEPAREYITKWASQQGWDAPVDSVGNVCVHVPGRANSKTSHPPLELLFTVDEEQGMTGSKNLDAVQLGITGQTLINTDSEDDSEITVGCSGGIETAISWKAPTTHVHQDWDTFALELAPLLGGHSGLEIAAGRANAIRVLASILSAIGNRIPLRLAAVDGGDRRNAIPRSCRAIVVLQAAETSLLRQTVGECEASLCDQFAGRDNVIKTTIQRVESAGQAFDAKHTRLLLDFLLALPTGVLGTTPEIPDLPETSNNLAVVATHGEEIQVVCSSRSSRANGLEDVGSTLASVARMAGAETQTGNHYPPWKPNFNSKILKLATDVYRRLFDAGPTIQAVHAGLECGVLATRIPGELDAISVGPTIRDNHAPRERVEIKSVQKSYRFLREVLAELSREDAAKPVILQSHLDIVVARHPDAPEGVDAEHGLIHVERGDIDSTGKFAPNPKGCWLMAPFTTLGADNGIGCAMGMSICDES